MANYKETSVTGIAIKYVRCQSGNFYFGSLGNNSVVGGMGFSEEEVTTLPDGEIYTKALSSSVHTSLADDAAPFNVYNQDTGEVTGTTTIAELKNILYSIYRLAASQRDAQPA